jgi:hypothetical protein
LPTCFKTKGIADKSSNNPGKYGARWIAAVRTPGEHRDHEFEAAFDAAFGSPTLLSYDYVWNNLLMDRTNRQLENLILFYEPRHIFPAARARWQEIDRFN